jgi:predicted amidohydrolase YtcJ
MLQNTHCIGDRANGMFLDLMEAVVEEINTTALRPRVEHAQIIAPPDFARLGKLGGALLHGIGCGLKANTTHLVIASVQPSHV